MRNAKPAFFCRTGFTSNLYNLLYLLVCPVFSMTDIKEGMEDAGDKIKAGAKAMGEKMKDTGKDVESEYNKEKLKEKLD